MRFFGLSTLRMYHEDKTYNRDLDSSNFQTGEYDHCVFTGCDLSNADLSESRFIDCEFINCNLDLVKLVKTVFRDVKFTGCKMQGLFFDSCDGFGLAFSFDNCLLSHSSFYQTKIKKTVFQSSKLIGVDFTGCDLTGSSFKDCELTNAKFETTIADRCDFREAHGYSIDPEQNRIRKARFSITGLAGLLDKYDIEIDNR